MATQNKKALRCERYGDDEAVLNERYNAAFQWGCPAEAKPVDETTAAAQRAELAAALATFDAYTSDPPPAVAEFLHIASNWQHLLGRGADLLGLDAKVPRALCGADLVTDDEPVVELNAVICPACAALNGSESRSEAEAAGELDHRAVR